MGEVILWKQYNGTVFTQAAVANANMSTVSYLINVLPCSLVQFVEPVE